MSQPADSDAFPRCAACGTRIGYAEPVAVERDDGTLRAAPVLAIRDLAAPRIWHAACAAPRAPSDAA